MEFNFPWIGYKRDGRNKLHVWGVLYISEEDWMDRFVVWGPANGPVYKRRCGQSEFVSIKKEQKIRDGYRQIESDDVKTRLPVFHKELEMLFMYERLSGV